MKKNCHILAITTIAFWTSLASAEPNQPKLNSRQNRETRSNAVIIQAPTLTVGDDVGSGEMGVRYEKFLNGQQTVYASLLEGIAGHLGHSAGQGSVVRVSAGGRQFFGNSFYISPGVTVRHLDIGAIEMRDSSDPYDSTSVGYEVGKTVSTSLGASCATGFLWQHKRVTIGVELASVFVPYMVLQADGKSTDTVFQNEQAQRRARSNARSGDVTLPRFVMGFSW